MFVDSRDFVLTEEKAGKIARKIEVLRIKQAALATIAALFEPHDGKVLNARVFNDVKKAYDSKDLFAYFDWTDYNGLLELRLFGQSISYDEGRCFFISDSIKKGNRLDYETLRAEMLERADSFGERIAENEKALKTLKSKLKKALKAFETLKTVAYSIPFEIREEFRLFKECF